ncbi:MAG: cytochrome P450 [Candidatus Binatia bacterium]
MTDSTNGANLTDGFDLIDPQPYAKNGTPHASWTALRRHDPLHRCEPAGYAPFWAVTKHADVFEISNRPDVFLSYPGIVHPRADLPIDREEGVGAMRTIIEMDPPQHRTLRKVASPWFTPRALGRLDETIEESARHLIGELAEKARGREGEIDFATEIATSHPLRILATILGVSREDEPRILKLTNQLFAADDPELQRKAENRQQAIMELGMELFHMFDAIIQDRRANPRDDLASLYANATVNGEPMGVMDTLGYYLITFTAGHDTTKNSLAGGMCALAQNPDQFAALQKRPELIGTAVDEVVRWATPVNYMRRTAARDVELRGKTVREGDHLVMFYASANRDEEVFQDPFAFRIDRDPNPHLGFGIGEHFCLGANLARRSQRALFAELARRVESVELAGTPEWIQSSFVVGLKHLPLRYRMRADA